MHSSSVSRNKTTFCGSIELFNDNLGKNYENISKGSSESESLVSRPDFAAAALRVCGRCELLAAAARLWCSRADVELLVAAAWPQRARGCEEPLPSASRLWLARVLGEPPNGS